MDKSGRETPAELAHLAATRDGAKSYLARSLRDSPDLEVRRRLERLLKPLEPRAPQRLRECRAVLALEARGTPAARRLLRLWAEGHRRHGSRARRRPHGIGWARVADAAPRLTPRPPASPAPPGRPAAGTP